MLRCGALIAVLAVAVNAGGNLKVPATGSVSFQSENFPNLYPNSHTDQWTFEGPEGSPLQFDAVSFDLENSCSYDWVEVVDTASGESLGKSCGSSGPSGVRTSSNVATVNFKTDSSVNRGGFNISVRVAKCKAGVGLCPNHEDICLPNSGWCNGTSECPDGIDEQCPDLSQCGKSVVPQVLSRRGHKIVGGVEAQAHSWPWQIAFTSSGGSQFCGGTIISNRWVMTAAHCCAGRTASGIRARVGAHSLTSPTENTVNHEIEKIVNHPQYSTYPSTDRDFCLLKTKTPIQFNAFVASACLPDVDDALEAAGTECYITGWGTTSSGGGQPNKLQQTSVKISDQEYCNRAYGSITPTMICAAEPGRDTCQGDSGGPLVCKDKITDAFKLVGVTSWGRGCADPGYPGVYARTSKALDWITQNIIQG